MDIIYIKDLRIKTMIGVYSWERKIRQTVTLDIEMAADIVKASGKDDIVETLDYAAVARRLVDFVGDSKFELIETLAERVASLLLDEFNIPWVRLRVGKQGALKGVRNIGVMIERQKTGASRSGE